MSDSKYNAHALARPGAAAMALLLAVALGGCATPAGRFEDFAQHNGFRAADVAGGEHVLRVWHKGDPAAAGRVHVYLDGDGTPWLSRTRIASDPTPRDPLVVRLMQRDTAPVMLLGRPCYHRDGMKTAGCHPRLWTTQRYGETVVASMSAALQRLLEPLPGVRVSLIGYSGGGALAMLIAARVQRVDAVMTVAAPLDTAAWSASHGMAPLDESLNPATAPRLRAQLAQLHVAGGRDDQVSATIVDAFVRARGGTVVVRAEADHRCCWEAAWPQLLARFERAAEAHRTRSRGPGEQKSGG